MGQDINNNTHSLLSEIVRWKLYAHKSNYKKENLLPQIVHDFMQTEFVLKLTCQILFYVLKGKITKAWKICFWSACFVSVLGNLEMWCYTMLYKNVIISLEKNHFYYCHRIIGKIIISRRIIIGWYFIFWISNGCNLQDFLSCYDSWKLKKFEEQKLKWLTTKQLLFRNWAR